MKRSVLGVLFSLFMAVSVRAQAQEESAGVAFGEKGHFVIGGERMFGYVHISQKQSVSGMDETTTNNSISLLGSPISAAASVYTFPRVGFDMFVAPGISLGTSLTYFHLSSSQDSSDTTLNGFMVTPRIGFAARLGRSVWLWPRAGVTYVYVSTTENLNFTGTSTHVTASTNLFAATIEAPLAIAVSPNMLILIGPTVDIGLSGSSHTNPDATTATTVSQDVKETDIGLQAGFVGYF